MSFVPALQVLGNPRDVPDSCCHPPPVNTVSGLDAKAQKGCGCLVKNEEGACIAHDAGEHGQLSILTDKLKEKIWQHGCIEILKSMMRNELVETGTAWVYISLGLLLALLELVTVALAAAFVAQINRSLPGRHGVWPVFVSAMHESGVVCELPRVWYCLYLCHESGIVGISARSLVLFVSSHMSLILSVSLPGVLHSLYLCQESGFICI